MNKSWVYVKSLFAGIIGHILGAILIFAAPVVIGGIVLVYRSYAGRTVQLGAVLFLFGGLVLLAGVGYASVMARSVSVCHGRERALQATLRILRSNLLPGRRNYLFSTRVSFWPVDEVSENRTECRNLITRHIEKGLLVKRLWQVQNIHDFRRMQMYLDLYKEFDNYSLACFVGRTLLPELVCASGRAAVVSITETSSPRKMTISFSFRRKKEVAYWEEYFGVLWDAGIHIKTGGEIDQAELSRVIGEVSALR